ncbi:hypothetical protein OFM77_18360, partial [Acinetobacter baumannii]|nr:hypothetical protein [Acinetobacter baumannii]
VKLLHSCVLSAALVCSYILPQTKCWICLLYTSPSPRDSTPPRMPASSWKKDEELINAMKFFAERMKMVVEPTGCLGFAAARNLKDELKGKRIGIILSGSSAASDIYKKQVTVLHSCVLSAAFVCS